MAQKESKCRRREAQWPKSATKLDIMLKVDTGHTMIVGPKPQRVRRNKKHGFLDIWNNPGGDLAVLPEQFFARMDPRVQLVAS